MRARLRWILAVLSLGLAACREPAPAPPPPAVLAPPPPAPPAPPPPAPPAPPPAAPTSALRAALLAARDLPGFRALAADQVVVLEIHGNKPARPIFTVRRDRLDPASFAKLLARLPHEPDPAGGEGEDFQCDDAAHSCVFSDENGRATRYVFAPGDKPQLREIRIEGRN
jgi:hypothetical protein